jgi:hypothetical protein
MELALSHLSESILCRDEDSNFSLFVKAHKFVFRGFPANQDNFLSVFVSTEFQNRCSDYVAVWRDSRRDDCQIV